jgi:S1-C subfamily serine protease
MRALSACAVALSIAFSCGAAASEKPPISHWLLNKQIDVTNFLVNKGCSGTLVDLKGDILTANHCVMDQFEDVQRDEVDKDGKVKKVTVRISKPGTVSQIVFAGPSEVQRTTFVYKVKAHDPDHDLALVDVLSKLPNDMRAPVSCTEPRRLDPVWAVGNPFGILYSSATAGIVASTQRDYRLLGIDGESGDATEQPGDNGLIQHTAPIEGGNSGGALYNEQGELVGVNVRGSRVNETVAFAVPLDDVRKFLKDSGVDMAQCK